jgi:crotonobetainyl-CoA:carnitine CoA-transferase CaiB-like acyl-CoA transferase
MATLAGQLPVAPVLDLPQALDNPFVLRTGMVQHLPHPQLPSQRVLANPVRVDGQRLPGRACSALGADTDALLRELGCSDGDIRQLREQGVV